MYYIKCDSDYEITRERDLYDEWDIGDDGCFNHSFSVSQSNKDYEFSFDLDDPSDYTVLAVIYTTGCTFGYTSGNVQYIGPIKNSDVEEVTSLIYNEPDSIKKFDKNFYCPYWVGYFERLESVIEIPCG